MVVTELRKACARVAEDARHVRINAEQIPLYAASLPTPPPAQAPPVPDAAERSLLAWYWLTMDAINFGSGWFPTLRKRPGRSGYTTISSGLRAQFDAAGPWSARELQELRAPAVAAVFDQEPEHELIALFVASLNDLGARLATEYDGDPLALITACDRSAPRLVELLAGWSCFEDVSSYHGISVPFNKRSQIAAADLARAGVAEFEQLELLTMFADNLVPHVLRLDGILAFSPDLVARIDRGELIEHGSDEEVEIRACAVQTVELIVDAWAGGAAAAVSAGQVDQLLWQRGQGRRYKASPGTAAVAPPTEAGWVAST